MDPLELNMSDAFMDRLVGEWTYEGRSIPDTGEVPTGIETVTKRGVWLVIESDDDARFQLAFDAETGRVTGDFVNWNHASLWTYDGAAEGDRMVLKSRGPRFDGMEGETDYEDVWEILTPDERVLTGRVLGDDGQWRDFNETRYRRRS